MPELFRLISEKTINLLKKIPKHYILPIIVFSLGLMFFTYGLIQYLNTNKFRENILKNNFTESKGISQQANLDFTPSSRLDRDSVITPALKTITIDVEGAVQNPGIYSLSLISHLQDGLIAAGGFTSGADRSWISKNLNLAENLTDGEKLYIPRIGEEVVGVEITPTEGTSRINDTNGTNGTNDTNVQNTGLGVVSAGQGLLGDGRSMTLSGVEGMGSSQVAVDSQASPKSPKKKKTRKASTGKTKSKKQKSTQHDALGVQAQNVVVSINKASINELSQLPGVKTKTAQKIINKRPYGALEDLLKKKAVSKKTFEKIKDKITL